MEITREGIALFGFFIHWYGVLIALGVLLGVLLAVRREEKLGLKKDTVLDLALVCVPGAVICARIYYVVFSWDVYRGDFWSVFRLWEGGLAIYGAILGGALTAWIFAKVKKIHFAVIADLCAPALAIGQAIGRWGNFLNQEAYGAPVKNPAWQFFPAAVNISGTWHYATFFYESVWCALIVFALLLGEKTCFFRKKGDTFSWYLFLYGLERSLVEGLRTDSLYLGPVRVSQALSLLLVLGAGIFLIRHRLRSVQSAVWAALWAVFAVSALFLPWPAKIVCAAAAIVCIYTFYKNKNTKNESCTR